MECKEPIITTKRSPYRILGSRPVRPDGADKVTGRALYGADIRLPGMLYGKVKRSPYAHAHVKRIDTSRALSLPGVKAVVTSADFRDPGARVVGALQGATPLRWLIGNVMALDKVLYHGHPVAAVCATDPHIAEDALALIEVEYEPLPPVLNVLRAMEPDAPILHEGMRTSYPLGGGDSVAATLPTNVSTHLHAEMGNVENAFARAEIVIQREFETGMAHQGYIEPQNGTASWSADGRLTVWTSTQGAYNHREQLAMLLGMSSSDIRVVPMEIGGGFGAKLYVYLEPLAALLARKACQPVKMTMSREEVLQATGPTSGTYVRARLGAMRDGTLVAGQVYFAYEAGAYPPAPIAGGLRTAFAPYEIPNLCLDGYEVVVNKPKVRSYRAPGAAQTTLAVEALIDELAEQLDADPMDLRLQNAARQGSRRPDGTVYGVIGNVEVMEAMRGSDHYRSDLSGARRGRGVGVGYWHNGSGQYAVNANINADGTVNLVAGAVDIGGQRAAMAMQFAEALAIPYEDVHPVIVDTDSIGYTGLTAGSGTTAGSGSSVVHAAADIRRRFAERAAKIWDVESAAVRYDDDGVVRGPATADGEPRALTFKQVAAQLLETGGTIVGHADSGTATAGASFAGHIVDVEVDIETGKVQVLRYTVVQDVGKAIHPSYVEGQLQGGASQGAGMALWEEYWYDEEGVLRNSSLLDYRTPTALDLPNIDTILVEVEHPGHPYGVRGVGELPIVPPLGAIANAVSHALGFRVGSMPATPRKLLQEILEREHETLSQGS